MAMLRFVVNVPRACTPIYPKDASTIVSLSVFVVQIHVLMFVVCVSGTNVGLGAGT